ncbi:MAG: leucine-rich repeat protein, partial [Bacillota bacterium]
MQKNYIGILIVVMLFVLSIGMIGCSTSSNGSEITYTITFMVDDVEYHTTTLDSDESIFTMPESPSKDEYIFAGWCEDAECTILYDANSEVLSDITLYAKWEEVVVENSTNSIIGFYASDGVTINYTDKTLYCQVPYATTVYDIYNTIKNTSNSTMTIFNSDFTQNYLGMVSLDEGANTYYLQLKSLDGLTITNYTFTIYKNCIYDVTFSSNGVETICNVEDGDTVETISATEKTGYTFWAWLLDDEVFDFATPITSDITLVAEYLTHSYTVVFDANSGSGTISNQILFYDATQSLTTNTFTKEGYTFVSWNTKADGSGESYSDEHIAPNVTAVDDDEKTLYAQWEANSYTIAFDANSGSGSMASQGFTYDEIQSITINTFTKTGYTFVSWNTSADGTGTSYTDSQSIENLTSINDESITLYAQWQEGSAGLAYTLNSDGISYSLAGIGSATDTDIVITNTYDGLPITAISSSAFRENSNIKSVTIGENVTSIGSYAFRECSGLTSIVIPDSVTSIGDWAFYKCSSLVSASIGDGVESIGAYSFDLCATLKSVTMGDSVTSIGICAFYFCTSLTNVSMGDSVTSIGNYAFSSCTSLTSIVIPDSVTTIGRRAFYYCTSLASVTTGASLESIGSYAFDKCTSLKSVILGDNLESIGSYAFYGCSSLTDLTIPDSVTSLGSDVFSSCSSLKSLSIPYGVTSLGDNSFYGCSSLTSLSIP